MSDDVRLVGRKIIAIRHMTESELNVEGWDSRYPVEVLVLDDGTLLYASQDGEGNGPGQMFGRNGDITFYVMAK